MSLGEGLTCEFRRERLTGTDLRKADLRLGRRD